ncbi:hypothetical protein ACQJBY_064861 [Aegilops geniculata]
MARLYRNQRCNQPGFGSSDAGHPARNTCPSPYHLPRLQTHSSPAIFRATPSSRSFPCFRFRFRFSARAVRPLPPRHDGRRVHGPVPTARRTAFHSPPAAAPPPRRLHLAAAAASAPAWAASRDRASAPPSRQRHGQEDHARLPQAWFGRIGRPGPDAQVGTHHDGLRPGQPLGGPRRRRAGLLPRRQPRRPRHVGDPGRSHSHARQPHRARHAGAHGRAGRHARAAVPGARARRLRGSRRARPGRRPCGHRLRVVRDRVVDRRPSHLPPPAGVAQDPRAATEAGARPRGLTARDRVPPRLLGRAARCHHARHGGHPQAREVRSTGARGAHLRVAGLGLRLRRRFRAHPLASAAAGRRRLLAALLPGAHREHQLLVDGGHQHPGFRAVRPEPDGPGARPDRAAGVHGYVHLRRPRYNLLHRSHLRPGHLRPHRAPQPHRRARHQGPRHLRHHPSHHHHQHRRQRRRTGEHPRRARAADIHVRQGRARHGAARHRLAAVAAARLQRELRLHLAAGKCGAHGAHRRRRARRSLYSAAYRIGRRRALLGGSRQPVLLPGRLQRCRDGGDGGRIRRRHAGVLAQGRGTADNVQGTRRGL